MRALEQLLVIVSIFLKSVCPSSALSLIKNQDRSWLHHAKIIGFVASFVPGFYGWCHKNRALFFEFQNE
jgi:hypothetical protein